MIGDNKNITYPSVLKWNEIVILLPNFLHQPHSCNTMNRMNHRPYSAVLVAGMLFAITGCDNAQDPIPASAPSVATDPPGPKVPATTQEVLDAPRKSLPLKLIPFTIEAPENWQIVAYDDRVKPVTMIEGKIIDDEVRISLGLREPMSGEILRNYLNRLQKEDAELKKIGGSVKVTEENGYRIIDLRRPPTKTDLPSSEQSMDWRITVLYPSGIAHDQYVLQFIGLTLESYEKNKEYLDGILKTIRYENADAAPLPPRR